MNKDELGNLIEKATSGRVPYYHPTFPLIIYWSEKSACTSVVTWFLFHCNLLDEAKNYSDWIHDYEQKILKQEAWYNDGLCGALLKGKKKVVKFVRNPFRRAVSSFVTLSEIPSQIDKDHFGYKAWLDIRQFLYGSSDTDKGCTFEQYLLWLKHTGVRRGQVDNHFACQYDPIETYTAPEILRIEKLSEHFSRIEDQFGLKNSPDQLHKPAHAAKYADSSEEEVFADLQLYPGYVRNRTLPKWSSFYNNTTKEMVEDIFDEDFRNYDYGKGQIN